MALSSLTLAQQPAAPKEALCKVMRTIPPKATTWPLDLVTLGTKSGSTTFELNHNKHHSVPAGIHYTAEIDPSKDGLVVHLDNMAKPGAAIIVPNFFYIIDYGSDSKYSFGPVSSVPCYATLSYQGDAIPKVTLGLY